MNIHEDAITEMLSNVSQRAYEIYCERVEMQEPGSEEEDWARAEAEEQLESLAAHNAMLKLRDLLDETT